jgi:putative membrane protein
MAVEGLATRRSAVPAVLAAAAVALQVAYPVTAGAARDRLTVAIVLAFAAAGAAHAIATRGWRTGGAAVAAAALVGFAAEVVGVDTGWPFGVYAYGDVLGPRLLGVPLLVPIAWTMIAWPAAVVARRLVATPAARVAVGAWALAAWDVFLDPQMVAAGAWRWSDPTPHLPGVPDVPLSNYAGWLMVAVVVSAIVQWVLRRDEPRADAVPVALYLWTWIGSAVALAVFLHRPAAAAWGAVAMGVVAGPLVRSLRR